MDLGTISSDDVIEAYKQQLADAHDKIAFLTAQVTKANRVGQELEQKVALYEYDQPSTPGRAEVTR